MVSNGMHQFKNRMFEIEFLGIEWSEMECSHLQDGEVCYLLILFIQMVCVCVCVFWGSAFFEADQWSLDGDHTLYTRVLAGYFRVG